MSSAAHIVVLKDTLAFHCERCGATELPKVPCEVRAYVAAGKAFAKVHLGCGPTQQPGRGGSGRSL